MSRLIFERGHADLPHIFLLLGNQLGGDIYTQCIQNGKRSTMCKRFLKDKTEKKLQMSSLYILDGPRIVRVNLLH